MEVAVSQEGILISAGKRDLIPFTEWKRFACAYIMDVSWSDTDRSGFRNRCYAAYYVILAEEAVTDHKMQIIAAKLRNTKPRGKIGEIVVFRSSEEHNAIIRECIDGHIPLIEVKKNAEGELLRI